jgi:hypothetical protein
MRAGRGGVNELGERVGYVGDFPARHQVGDGMESHLGHSAAATRSAVVMALMRSSREEGMVPGVVRAWSRRWWISRSLLAMVRAWRCAPQA